MNKILKNLQDPITDLIGLAIMLITVYEIYFKDWTWLWEGLTGLGVGLALFMFPDEWLKKTLEGIINKFTKDKTE